MQWFLAKVYSKQSDSGEMNGFFDESSTHYWLTQTILKWGSLNGLFVVMPKIQTMLLLRKFKKILNSHFLH